MADSAAPGSEILEIGRTRRPGHGPRSRRGLAWLASALVLVLLLVGGVLLRRALEPPPDFTMAQLRGAYAGMAQRNGTSYVFPIDRASFGAATAAIGPPSCRALFRTTVGGRFPDDAVDGMLAYWLSPDGAIELFTLRYVDAASARAGYAAVSQALGPCADQPITISDRVGAGRVRPLAARPGSILAAAQGRRADRVRQSAYLLDLGDQGRFAISATLLRNTVTWQYRTNEVVGQDPADALQSLNDAFVVQLLAVASTAASP